MLPRSRQVPEHAQVAGLRDWYQLPIGQSLLREETALIDRLLRQYHGPNLLELSMVPHLCDFTANHFPRRLCLGTPSQQQLGQHLDTLCRFHELPVATESQDVVVIHHLLEFSEQPHALLREVERVITPHGKIIIAAFNPYSLLSLRFLFQALRQRPSAPRQLLSSVRLSDWLRLLGFEVNGVDFGFHRIPLNKPQWFLQHGLPAGDWLRHIPLGGSVILSATKYRAPLTPAKIRWAPRAVANIRPLGAARVSSSHNKGSHGSKGFQGSAVYRRGMSG